MKGENVQVWEHKFRWQVRGENIADLCTHFIHESRSVVCKRTKADKNCKKGANGFAVGGMKRGGRQLYLSPLSYRAPREGKK